MLRFSIKLIWIFLLFFCEISCAQNIPIQDSCPGGVLYYPTGNYTINQTITITHACKVTGDGMFSSKVLAGQNGMVLFDITTSDPVIFRDLGIFGNGRTGTIGIKVDPVSASNTLSKFENLVIDGHDINLDLKNACMWGVDKSYITNPNAYGIKISNIVLPDGGDSNITNNIFDSQSTSKGIAVYQINSGGLKFRGNKVLRHQHGYILNLADTTSILLIEGNSFELQGAYGIVLENFSGASFYHAVINGNQFSGQPYPIAMSGVGWMRNLIITNNSFNLLPGYSYAGLIGGTTNGYIGGNVGGQFYLYPDCLNVQMGVNVD